MIQTEYSPRTKPCTRCSSTDRKTGEFRASGGIMSAFFNLDTERFTYVSCGNCGYTEFYSSSRGSKGEILDFLG